MKNIKKMYLGIFLTFLLTIGLFNGLPVNENAYAQEDNIVSEEAVTEEQTTSEDAVISDDEVSEEVVTEEGNTTEEVSGENEYDIDENAYASLNEVQRASLDQIKNAPKSEVKVPKMKMGIVSGAFLFKDGTPTFTPTGGIDGNDDGANNQIVRSFDNVVYQVDFGFNGVEATDLVVEATVPADQGQDGWYAWDDVLMGLLEYDVELSGDGRTAKIFFDKYEVGQGTSVKIPLAVYGALNGEDVKPQFKVYVAGEEVKPENVMDVLPVTISATPTVNVQIPQTSLTEVAVGFEGDGYYYSYVFVPLQVSLAAPDGGKGSAETAGKIGFDVTLDSYVTNSATNSEELFVADSTKYKTSATVVDYGLVNSDSKLSNVSMIGKQGDTGNKKDFALAGKQGLGTSPYYSVFDSGVMSATQSGNKVSVSFENYVNNIHNTTTVSSDKPRGEVPFISGGLIIKVKGENQKTKAYNLYASAKVSAITSGTSVSGDSIIGQNAYTDDDEVKSFPTFRAGTRSMYINILYPGYDSNEVRAGGAKLAPGQNFRITSDSSTRLATEISESKFIQITNFDPRVMELESEWFYDTEAFVGTPHEGKQHMVTGLTTNDISDYYEEGAYKYEYGVSSDCSDKAISARKGIDDVPANTTNPYNNVTWYDTIEEAKAAETGGETGADGVIKGNKLCAARFTLTPGRQILSGLMGVYSNYGMRVRNNGYTNSIVDTGMTAMVTTYSIGYNDDYDFNNQTGTYYEMGAGYRGGTGEKTTSNQYEEYVKPIFDADGNHINADKSNQMFPGRGNALRLYGYDLSVDKTVANDDGSALAKDNSLVPRIDNTVKWTLAPKTFGGDYTLGADNPLVITDTLPAGLKVDESSITPKADSVTKNADGTTTLVWKYTNVTLGEEIAPITYVTEVDRFSVDGTSYVNTVDATLGDKSASADKSITVLDDSNFIVEKEVDNKFIEKDGEINYTLTFQNRGTKDEDVVIYDILPYNGDNDISKVESGKRATDFNGTYEVTSHSTDATNYEVIYSFDENIKTHTLDEATFKTEEEWGSEFDLTKVTIIGYKINAFKPQAKNTVDISIKTNGNKTHDVYENNYSLWFNSELNGQPVQIPLNSNAVRTEVLSRTITGTTWVDDNVDGLRQDKEELLANVPVMLYVYDANGKAVPYINDDGVEYKTTTDANGFYEFNELKPGVYVVVFDIALYGDKEQHLTVDNSHDYTLNSDAKWIEVESGKFAIIDTIDLTAMPDVVPGERETYIDASNHNDAGVIPLHEVELEKSTEDVNFSPGQEMTYKVKVSNVGNAAVNNVIVADDFADPKFDQSSVKVVSVVDATGAEASTDLYDASNVFSIVFATIPVGESYTITYTVNVSDSSDEATTEQLVNEVSAISDETEIVVDEVAVDPLPVHKMELEKVTDDVTYSPGQEITYKVKVTNTGNATLNNVIVADDFADPKFDQSSVKVVGVADLSGAELADNLYDATNVFSIVFGTLPVGEAYTITYTVNVLDTVSEVSTEQLENTVTATSDETDPIEEKEVVDPLPVYKMELEKVTEDVNFSPGQEITYKVKVTNTGNATLTNVIVADDFADPKFDQASVKVVGVADLSGAELAGNLYDATDVFSIVFGTLPVGEAYTITYTVNVLDTVSEVTTEQLVNTVTAVSDETDPIEEKEVVDPLPVHKMELEKIAEDVIYSPGQEITYKVKVTNTGNATLNNVIVADDFADPKFDQASVQVIGVVDLSGADLAGDLYDATDVFSIVFGTLPVGETYTITYTVNVLDTVSEVTTEQLVNTVTAVSDETELIEDNEELDPLPVHRIELEKIAEDVTFEPGQEMTYKVKVSNVGNSTVNNVIVADDFADPKFDQSTVKVVSVVDSAGVELEEELYNAEDVFSIVFGTLPVHESYTITYTVKVKANASTTEKLVNTVTAVSDETEMIEDTVNVDPLPEVELSKTGMTYFGSIIAMLLLGLIVIARMVYNKRSYNK